jgi:hypothetical protein
MGRGGGGWRLRWPRRQHGVTHFQLWPVRRRREILTILHPRRTFLSSDDEARSAIEQARRNPRDIGRSHYERVTEGKRISPYQRRRARETADKTGAT